MLLLYQIENNNLFECRSDWVFRYVKMKIDVMETISGDQQRRHYDNKERT